MAAAISVLLRRTYSGRIQDTKTDFTKSPSKSFLRLSASACITSVPFNTALNDSLVPWQFALDVVPGIVPAVVDVESPYGSTAGIQMFRCLD